MTVVLTLGSAQLFVLGVIGEYLGRLYIQSKNRPLFIIDEVVRLGSPEIEHHARNPTSIANGRQRQEH
jgi:dolichol-phosphate mannosyltransferase